MRGLTKDAIERLRGVVEELRVGPDDLISLNAGIPGQRFDYFSKLVPRDRAGGILVIALPVQNNEFDRFHQVNISQIPVG
jgi:hypothetical protein